MNGAKKIVFVFEVVVEAVSFCLHSNNLVNFQPVAPLATCSICVFIVWFVHNVRQLMFFFLIFNFCLFFFSFSVLIEILNVLDLFKCCLFFTKYQSDINNHNDEKMCMFCLLKKLSPKWKWMHLNAVHSNYLATLANAPNYVNIFVDVLF